MPETVDDEGDEQVREIIAPDGQGKVFLMRRSTGTYYFEEWYFDADPMTNCWLPQSRQMISFFDSAETALREAVARVSWMQQTSV